MVVIVYGLLMCYYFVCEINFKEKGIFSLDDKIIWSQSLKENNFDYAVLGSSRIYTGLNIVLLDSLKNLKGVNLGSDGASYAENYLILKQFFENKNIIRKIFIGFDIYSLNSKRSYSIPLHKRYFINYWQDEDTRNTIKDYSTQTEIFSWYVFPFTRYLKFNFHFSPYTLIKYFFVKKKILDKSVFDSTNGSEFFDGEFKPSKYEYKIKTYNVEKLDLKYINKIISLCKKNNCNVSFVRPPQYSKINQFQNGTKQIEDIIKELSNENEISIYDFKYTYMANDSAFFRDNTHLNYKGVKQFTNIFSEIL